MSVVLIALGIGFAVGSLMVLTYMFAHVRGYCRGRNDYIEALEWVLLNDPVARRDLVEGLAEKDESDRLQDRINAYRQAAREQRN